MGIQTSAEEFPIGDADILRRLEEVRLRFVAGKRTALFEFIILCGRFQAVMPDWVVDELLEIDEGIQTGRIKDFNEAFGRLEKVNTRAARARMATVENAAIMELTRIRLEDRSFSPDIFEDVAVRLQQQGYRVNQRDVRDIYQANKATVHTVPQKPKKKGDIYAVGNVVFPKGRRRGRPML